MSNYFRSNPNNLTRGEVAFNIGMQQAMFVGNTYIKAGNSYLNGDLISWFWNLKLIYEILTPDMSEEEIKETDLKINKILKFQARLRKKNSKELQDKLKRIYVAKITTFQREIFKYMKMFNYVPTKKDRTRLSF